MAYFEWADDLFIDGGPIDADHRHLIDLVNELHTATSAGLGHGVVAAILEKLTIYTREHFTREERIMEQLGFPGIKGHRAGHQEFIGQVLELQRKYEAGRITVAAQLSSLLRDWLSLHIRRSDRELLVFMKSLKKAQAKA